MKKSRIVAGIVTLLFVLTAFAVMATPARAAAQEEDVLYLAMQQDVPDLNYFNLASNSVWKAYVLGWGFEGLLGLDYDQLPMPVLAEELPAFDEPNLTWTFPLRHGVTFHDGSPFNADDVVFTYMAMRENTTISGNLIPAFDGDDDGTLSEGEMAAAVTKVDDYTVKMVMAKSYGSFLTTTAGIAILPEENWADHLTDDGLIDVLWIEKEATIGTGAWMYTDGQLNTYRVMEKYPGYWGKNETTPLGYNLYPPVVDKLYFKVYASLDTAILALQSGAVDHVLWPITAGRVPTLQADPNIKLMFLEDNGYRYLAFNMKLDPMGNISFRKAVSHLIDKDQIVNVYMGGFGSKGDSCEPPFWGEWYNETVEKYPYDDPLDATTTIPEDLLEGAGFIDRNGDGWRDLPDGTPMEKITILTPPADYDPIRIRAGQMIAKNMRAVGINAEAKAIDFDTLVTRMNSYDYQMLIIGWSLSSDPMINVFDILGPKGTSNYFGFWAEDDPNPFYSGLMGVNTRADDYTQDLARQLDDLGQSAYGSFDVDDQIFYTSWGQGVVAEAIPCNVLYYQVMIMAYRSTWTGFMPWFGEIVGPGTDIFTMSELKRTGAGGGGVVATQSVNAGLTLPGKVGVGETVAASVVAIDQVGVPVDAGTVSVEVEGVAGAATVTASSTSGSTSTDGVFAFDLTAGDVEGYSYVNVTVTKGGVSSTQSNTIRVVKTMPPTLSLLVAVEEPVLRPTEDTNVSLTVIDEYGDPVEGATVSIDPTLIGYGSVDESDVTTDADGWAQIVYTAPDSIDELNAHLTVSLSFAATKDGYLWTGAASANVLIYNELEIDWTMVQITDVAPSTAMDSAANTTAISILVVDDDNVPVQDYSVSVMYSNDSMVFDIGGTSDNRTITDVNGEATIDVQLADMADSGAVRVTIANKSVLNSVPATVTLTYEGTTAPAATMYGGYMSYVVPQYLEPVGSLDVVTHIWDHTGAPADGINASLIVSGTAYGSLVWSADTATGDDNIYWDSTWDGWGINILTEADGANLVTSGPFNTYYDYDDWNTNYNEGWIYWDDYGYQTGVDVVNGYLNLTLYGVDVAPLDLIGLVHVVPEGMGIFNYDTTAYNILGQTTISTEYVVGKGTEVAATSLDIAKPVLTAKTLGFDSTKAMVTVTDKDNAPIEGAGVRVYQNGISWNRDYVVVPFTSSRHVPAVVPTDADGYAEATIIAIGRNDVVAPAGTRADVYAKGSVFGSISLFAQNQIVIHTQHAFATIEPISDVHEIGSALEVKVTVTKIDGAPAAYVPVELAVGGGATAVQATLASDVNGVAVFQVDTSAIANARAAFVTLQAKVGGPAWELGLAVAAVPMMNEGPTIAVLYPEDDGEVAANVTLSGSVFDANGIQTVKMTLDQDATVTLAGTAGELTWAISEALGDLDSGEHTIVLNSTDMLGVSSEITVTFTATKDKAESSMLAWAVAAIGWIVAAVVIVMMLMRKPKGAETMTPAEPEVEKEEPKTS